MTEEMKKLRDELAKDYSKFKFINGINEAIYKDFKEGFDACYKEMQTQDSNLYKAYEARIDEVISERDTLKQQLEIAVKALEFVRTDYGGYAKEVEEGSEAGYIWEHVSGRAKTEARQALTQIKELQGSPSVAADREELK